MSRNDSRLGSFSPTQRRACLVLALCVLAVVLSFVFGWVLLPRLLGRGPAKNGNYDPTLYPVDTTLGSVLPQATSGDAAYLSSTVFIGDEYVDSLYSTGQITLDQYLGGGGLDLGNILQRSCINFVEDPATYTVPQALAKLKARRAVVLLGSSDLQPNASVESFIMDYRNVLNALTTSYSYCDLIVSAVPPVTETSENAAARQTLIDQANQQLAVLCNELGCKFLNSAEALKAGSGYADATYFTASGFNASGAQALLNYVSTHAYDSQDRRPDTGDIPVRAQQAASATPAPTPTATPGKFTASYRVEETGKGTLKSGEESGAAELNFEVDGRTSISVTAVPAEGYEFYQWSDGQTSATRYDIVTKDISVTAMFNKKTTVALTINEGNKSIKVGESATFNASLKVNEEQGATGNVQWAVNGDIMHTGGSYTFTPDAAGTYTIRAGIEVDGVYASQEVTVTVQALNTSISISPGSGTIKTGESIHLVASVQEGSGNTTWSCDNGWSATGGEVDFTTNTAGTYTITATNNGAKATVTITVNAPEPTPAPTPTPAPPASSSTDQAQIGDGAAPAA